MRLVWSDLTDGTPCHVKGIEGDKVWMDIKFQANPVREVGKNGMCMLDVIESMIKRLSDFETKWPCMENRNAIKSLQDAQTWMINKRERRLRDA